MCVSIYVEMRSGIYCLCLCVVTSAAELYHRPDLLVLSIHVILYTYADYI